MYSFISAPSCAKDCDLLRHPDGAAGEERVVAGVVSKDVVKSTRSASVAAGEFAKDLNIRVSTPGHGGEIPVGVIQGLGEGELKGLSARDELSGVDEHSCRRHKSLLLWVLIKRARANLPTPWL
jgi:hypothetical protein